jgi:hypothetical protein
LKRFLTSLIVALVMITGILGITNPGFRQPYKLFGNTEGKLIHNYFIFSVYQQYYGYTPPHENYTLYNRYIGIALGFYEIAPVKEALFGN